MARRRKLRLTVLVPVAALVVVGGVLWAVSSRPQIAKSTESATTPASRNAMREASIRDLATAIKQYADSAPKVALAIPVQATPICSGVSSSCRGTKMVDLNVLVSRGLMNQIPSDPQGGYGRFVSGYEIARAKNGEITITAPRAEGKVLSVSVTP